MTASVIVCTYQAPAWLDLVLTGLQRQSRTPAEILVADDGSDDRTAAVVRARAQSSDCPIVHVWHEDEGVRKARIVNRAAAQARGEQLLFLDGDCIPQRHWVADHLRAADGQSVWCGRRCRLGARTTASLTPAAVQSGTLDHPLRPAQLRRWLTGELRRYGNAWRLPRGLATVLNRSTKGLMGCNFSLPRFVFERINGYDEAWPGMAALCEDLDLEIRLRLAGFTLRPLVNAAVVYHLHHDERPVPPEVEALRAERRACTDPWARQGLDGHR